MNIQIAIADDHPMIIGGLRNILVNVPHIRLLDTYPNGKSLLEGLKVQLPDVLLLDIQMPDKAGDELAPLILKRHPELKIIVLTNFDSSLYISNMFKSGVHGYVLKTSDQQELIKAIETVFRGETFLAPELKAKIQQLEVKERNAVSLKASLTSREKEILQHIVDGDTCAQTAKKLYLSVATVENYRVRILLKLGVNNAAALVKKALKLGLAN